MKMQHLWCPSLTLYQRSAQQQWGNEADGLGQMFFNSVVLQIDLSSRISGLQSPSEPRATITLMPRRAGVSDGWSWRRPLSL